MEQLVFNVPGMTCGHCEAAVKAEIAKVPGVHDVQVDLVAKTVVVQGSGVSSAAVITAVDEAGFEVVAGSI